MAKIGIMCDNYKLSKFETELKEGGFNDYKIKNLNLKSKVIEINTELSNQSKIKDICERVELFFYLRKN